MIISSLPIGTELNHKSVVKNTDAIELSVGDTVWNESITIRESQFWIYISCPSETNCEEINLTVSDSIGTQFSTTGRFHLELVGNLSAGQASIVVTRDGDTSQELIISHIFFDLNSGEFIDAPSQIPNPGEDDSGWPVIEMDGCKTLVECGKLDRTVIDKGASWWNGTLDDSEDSDSFRLNSSNGDLIEIGIAAHSIDLSIELWKRTESNLELISQEQFISGIVNQSSRMLISQQDGELWMTVRTIDVYSGLYSLRFAKHSPSDETTFGDAALAPWIAPIFSETTISGHLTNGDDGDSIRLEASSRSEFTIDWWLSGDADVYFQARIGSWIIVDHQSNTTGSSSFVVPPGADAAAITFNNSTEPLIWSLSITSHGPNDGGKPGDAPDNHPSGEAEILGWEILQSESGETNGVIGGDDVRDVYLISREEGFPDRNWLSATLESDPGSCSLKLMEMNTSSYVDWNIISWNISEMEGQQSSVGLELPHGRHLMVVESHTNEEVEYSIHWSWIDLESDESIDGEWIDYSSEINDFFIIIGFLLLSPWILIAYWRWKSGGNLELQAHEKRRLRRLRERLTQADPNDKMDPNALIHALESLADTDWMALLSEWGSPLVRHTTESLDLVVWELSSGENHISLTIGLTLQKEEWNLAGIRFQAIEGSEWRISNVVPENLFDGDEVFLGDIKEKTSLFFRIDLDGEAKGFDLILSGLVGGKPVAAVPTRAAILEEE